jgi:exodeoxyribonuclease VII small subunit
MAQAKKTIRDYATIQSELQAILENMQRDDLDVDQGLKCYETGLKLIAELKEYLVSAENKITTLKVNFSDL